MKSEDLMLGDWVQGFLPDTYSQIVGIQNEFGVSVITPNKCYMELSVDDIQPIPLTPEILKKNGFQTSDAKDGGFVLAEDYYDLFIYEWSDSIWVFRYECTEMDAPVEQFTLGYVHDLQHAFRLCGIEKEIVL